jgi:hypothetical protein
VEALEQRCRGEVVTEFFLLYFVLLAVTGWLTHSALNYLNYHGEIRRRRVLKIIERRLREED